MSLELYKSIKNKYCRSNSQCYNQHDINEALVRKKQRKHLQDIMTVQQTMFVRATHALCVIIEHRKCILSATATMLSNVTCEIFHSQSIRKHFITAHTEKLNLFMLVKAEV